MCCHTLVKSCTCFTFGYLMCAVHHLHVALNFFSSDVEVYRDNLTFSYHRTHTHDNLTVSYHRTHTHEYTLQRVHSVFPLRS